MTEDKITVDLYNDAWKQYVTYNKIGFGKVIGGLAKLAITTAAGGLGVYAAANASYLDVVNNPRSYDRRYKRTPHLRVGAQRKINAISNTARDEYASSLVEAGNSSNGLKQEVYSMINAQLQPVSIRSMGDLSSSILAKLSEVSTSIYRVQDFDACYETYRRNGYLLNRYISNYTLYDNSYYKFNNRYYYNCVLLDEINIHLNVLESDDILDDISYRLSNGIRLWNVENTDIGNYAFDNVERSLL
jgi:hypothetical protein